MATPGTRQKAGLPEEDTADESISLKGTFVKDCENLCLLFSKFSNLLNLRFRQCSSQAFFFLQ
jgi:hypothetical protein